MCETVTMSKQLFLELLNSQQKLSIAENKRNPEYKSPQDSPYAELDDKMLQFLDDEDLMDDYSVYSGIRDEVMKDTKEKENVR